MNAFFEHHQDSTRLTYRCFDRVLLNGLIQPFQQPERVIGFFNTYREGKAGDTRSSPRDCRPIQELGDEPVPEVESADTGGARRPS